MLTNYSSSIRHRFAETPLRLFALLSGSFPLALAFGGLGALGAEPFDSWQEMLRLVLESAAVFWILSICFLLMLWALWRKPFLEGDGKTPVEFVRRVFWGIIATSLLLTTFTVGRLLLYARVGVDILPSQPTWFRSWIFDMLGSPLWIIPVALIWFLILRPLGTRMRAPHPQ